MGMKEKYIDVFQNDFLLIPIHLESEREGSSHWLIAVVSFVLQDGKNKKNPERCTVTLDLVDSLPQSTLSTNNAGKIKIALKKYLKLCWVRLYPKFPMGWR